MATTTAVLVVAAACGAGGSANVTRTDSVRRTSGDVTVELVKPRGAEATAATVSSGGSVVAQTFVWAKSPFQWSHDGGARWQPSAVPSGAKGDRGPWKLLVAGNLVFVGGGETKPGSLPFIWVSEDGGRSFTAGAGVAAGLVAGQVGAVISVDDRLVAFGTVQVATATNRVSEAARWESIDHGRTWNRTPITGIIDPEEFPQSVAVGDRAVLATAVAVKYTPTGAQRTSHLLRSLDVGRTWSTIELDLDPDDQFSPVEAVGGLLVASTLRRTWTSDDDGQSWRKLGRAPVIADRDGTVPDPAESGAVSGIQGFGADLVAQVSSQYNNDHYLVHLGWSDDGGASWQPANMGVDCPGPEATSRVGGPLRVGSALVATWTCLSSENSGGHVLISTDQGHTWKDKGAAPLEGMELGAPVALDGGRVVALGAKNSEQSVDVVVGVSAHS